LSEYVRNNEDVNICVSQQPNERTATASMYDKINDDLREDDSNFSRYTHACH